jgi:phosphoenolpyruvate carboxylase
MSSSWLDGRPFAGRQQHNEQDFAVSTRRQAKYPQRVTVNPAISAEPKGIGTSRARDVLAREVKLLGALLGQVIVEQEGLAALELVERVRKATIAARRPGPAARTKEQAHLPVLQRSIRLRNPYVDSLSELQVLMLGRLRATPEDDPSRPQLLRLVHLTVSGVAAGLQNTG